MHLQTCDLKLNSGMSGEGGRSGGVKSDSKWSVPLLSHAVKNREVKSGAGATVPNPRSEKLEWERQSHFLPFVSSCHRVFLANRVAPGPFS